MIAANEEGRMYCPNCGASNADNAPFCVVCRKSMPVPASSAQPVTTSSSEWATPYRENELESRGPGHVYADFWPRLGAFILDNLFALLLAAVPATLVGFAFAAIARGAQSEPLNSAQRDNYNINIAFAGLAGGIITWALIALLYQIIMTARGGGWGMQIVGIRIVRSDNGEHPGFGKAIGRVVVRLAFAFVPFVGNFVQLLDNLSMLWDADKQTWHDKAAGTYVVKRAATPSVTAVSG